MAVLLGCILTRKLKNVWKDRYRRICALFDNCHSTLYGLCPTCCTVMYTCIHTRGLCACTVLSCAEMLLCEMTIAVPFVSLADEARSPVRSPLAAPPLRRPVPPLVSLVFPLFLEFPVFFSPVVLLSCPSFVSGALAWKHPLRVCPSRVLYLVPLTVMPSDPALTPCNM